MGVYNCKSIPNNKLTFEQIELLFQNTINAKEIPNSEKNISLQYHLLEEYNLLKTKSKLNKEILHISNNCKIISGFIPLSQRKEIFGKWLYIIYNFEKLEEYKKKRKLKIPNDKIFQMNLENMFENDNKSFIKLVRKGLPNNLRQHIWTLILDKNEKIKSNFEKEKIYFESLLSLKKNNKDIEQINKDIYRTFIYEKDKTEKNISLLKDLLIALNNSNEKIGYCQGINFIVAFILKVTKFNKIKAFHISRLILKKIKGYFTKDFPLLKQNLVKFNEGFTTLIPKLYCHFKDNDVIDELWVGKWFQTLFTINLPFREACLIWDVLLAYGMDFVIPIALSIIYINKKKLLKFNDSSDIISFLEETLNPNPNSSKNILYKENINLGNYIIPIDEIISLAKKIMFQLDMENNNGKVNNLNSYNNNLSKFENSTEKMKRQKIEENSIGNKSNPSQISTDTSSVNKINSYNLKSNIRINKFYTVHHKTDKTLINTKNIDNNTAKKENKDYKDKKDNSNSIRCFSHNNKNNNMNLNFSTPNKKNNNSNNLYNINSYNNKANMNFPFYEKDNFRNSNRLNGRSAINSLDIINNNTRNNIINDYNNRAFSANHQYQDSLTNLNLSGLSSDNKSFAFNNLYEKFNNQNYVYKTNFQNLNYYKNSFASSNYNKVYNTNNINLYNYSRTINTYSNHNTYLNPIYYNYYSNKCNRKGGNTLEIADLRLTEKNKLYGNSNFEINEIFSNGVNEFQEGENYINKIPNFNSIKGFNGN